MTDPRIALAISLATATTAAMASPPSFTSARSFAMGGTGVAVAHPASANSTNPAMLALSEPLDKPRVALTLLSLNARLADEEDVIDQFDAIQDSIDRINAAIDTLDTTRIAVNADRLAGQLRAVDRDTMRGDLGAGFSVALPGPGLSMGVFTDASARVTGRGTLSRTDLLLLEAIQDDPTLATSIDDIGDVLTSEGNVVASGIGEVGISLGHAFEVGDDNRLALGVSPKYVYLRTYEYTARVDTFDDVDYDDDGDDTDKSGFNADVGAAYRFGADRAWTAGLSVRNIIPMELDARSGRTLDVDPKVTAGIAYQGRRHVITADADLTEQEAFGYGDDTQWAALGAELTLTRAVWLRGGVRHNLSSNDDNSGIEEDTLYTFGLGLSPFGARLELSGLVSDAEVGAALELGAAF